MTNMDFDKLQESWHEAGKAMTPGDGSLNIRRKTSLERLAIRYQRFSLVALMAAGGPTMCMWLGSVRDRMILPAWLIICFEAYFLICFLMDYWLYRGIKSIDCSSMTVEDVLHKSMFYRKRHLQFIMLLIPMAVALLLTFGLYNKTDTYFLYGMLTGALFGLALGLRQFINFMHDYRELL